MRSLIVLGRHVPELQYITVLIGDEPVLSTPLRRYQRLLAGAGADAVVSSLVGARNQLLPWIQFAQNAPARPEPRVA